MSIGSVLGRGLVLALEMRLEIRERRPHIGEQQFAGELDRHLRRIAADARHQRHLHHLEGLAFLVGARLHRGGDRADETVGHQDAEEGARERGAHLHADLGVARALDGGHGVHDAEHGRHDAEAGQRIGHLLHRMRRLRGLLVVGLKLVVEQALELVGVEVAAHHQAQAVGDELEHVVVGHHLGVSVEQLAL
jgi:hypothetical protein